jgi:4-amino-4-deoxy-L-arabinose transferase-like glycosyltransferase
MTDPASAGARWFARHPDLVRAATVAAVALAIRAAFLYRTPVFITGDSQSHYLPGFDLVNGYGFDPELRRPPGYAAFVALSIVLAGEELRALAWVQHLAGVMTAVLTYVVGRVVWSPVVGLLGGTAVALNGALILSEHSVMTEALFGVQVTAIVAAFAWLIRRHGVVAAAALGVLIAIASLTRPVGQILVPVAIGCLLLTVRPVRKAALLATIVALGFVLASGPWMIRNLIEHGSLTASGGLGRSLVARTVKYDTGFFDTDTDLSGTIDKETRTRQIVRRMRNTVRQVRSVRPVQKAVMDQLKVSQAESDGLMRRVALAEIAKRPWYYTWGSLGMSWQIVVGDTRRDSFVEHWRDRDNKDFVEQWVDRLDHLVQPITRAERDSYGVAAILTSIVQPSRVGGILAPLVLLGIALSLVGRQRSGALFPVATGLTLVMASAFLDGPVPRYRYPVDPLIALLAASPVVTLAIAVRRRDPLAVLRGR